MKFSMTDKQMTIKSALLAHIDELVAFIDGSVVEGRSAHEVEKTVWERILALGHQALGLFFSSCGQGDAGKVIQLANGRQVKRLERLHRRPYLTVLGEFTLERFVYGSREGQKIESVPLDARLQLPASKFSCLLQDWDQAMATELPFGKVNDCLSRLLGFQQSVNSLEQTGQALSESVDSFWGQAGVPFSEEEGELMVMSADGKGVVMRLGELDAQETAAAKRQGRTGNKKMALVGSVYTVDRYPRSPDQVLAALFRDPSGVKGLPERPTPQHKRVRGALLRNDQGKTDPQSDEIFSWIAHEVKQRGLPGKKPLVMIMDGQESLWNAGFKHLPEDEFTVTEILDLIHVTSYVWTASHLFYPKNSPEASTYAKQQIRLLLDNQVTTVIDSLRNKGEQENLGQSATKTLETVCGYFTNQAHRMAYKDYLEQGLPVASGVIEGACRNVVKDRMEHSGMRWTMKGAHAMLRLRGVQLSGLWDEFMQHRIERENQRLHPSAMAANDAVFVQAKLA